MGLALGYGKGYQFRRRVVSSEGSKYISAATANGSSGGSATCADQTFNALQAIPALGFAEAKAYIDAATANSSSGGGVFCAEQTFFDLQNIA